MNKKTFFSFFFFSMLGLMPLSLTSCGEDIEVPNNPDNNKIDPTEGVATVFTSSSDDTRTSIDTNAKFYWEAGDYIWVDTLKNGTYTGKSHSIELSNPTQAPSAKFYFRQIVLTEPKYDLTYTGNNSNKGTEVTIATAQAQSEWNNAEHLGASGDCGVAEATRNNSTGTYSFSLKHKASYLIFQPYKATAISDGWKLKSIEIISDNTIAGTYPFNKTDGIVTTSTITNPSNTIKLTCDDNSDFTLPQSAYSEDNSCYMVIQPGTHKLTVRYEIQPTGSVNGVANATFYITKEVETTFKANGVRKIRHELDVLKFRRQSYMWDAPVGSSYVFGRNNQSTVVAPTQATRSAATMPNANEMYWYIKNGDPRWDRTTPWTLNAGVNVYSAGVWIKTKATISGEGNEFNATRSGLNRYGSNTWYNLDLRQYGPWTNEQFQAHGDPSPPVFIDESHHYKTAGKPANTSGYFYLPAMGLNGNVSGTLSNVGYIGYYWSKSPFPVPGNQNGSIYSYYFAFNPDHIVLRYVGDRTHGMTVSVSSGITYFQ
jgi:hypothetical protein